MTDQPLAIQPKAFETILLQEDLDAMPLPNGAPHFVVARKGAYVHKNMFFGRVLVPVKEITTLPDINGKGVLWLDVPPFPPELLAKAWSFFRWAWDERKSEAMVDIVWRPEKGYSLFIPPQTASAGGVKCVRNEEHYGEAQLIGTIHSHCNGSAYHSSTDTHDAEEHDGLHITLGRVSANEPDMDFMVSANKIRWEKIKPEEVLAEGKLVFTPHPEWWQRFHEHPLAVEKFKGQRFAAGARPVAPGRTYGTTNHRPYQGNQTNIWDNKDKPTGPTQTTPFASFQPRQIWRLGELMTEYPNLVEGVHPLSYHMNVDWAGEMLAEAIDNLETLGIRVTATATADRRMCETMIKRLSALGTEEGWDDDDDVLPPVKPTSITSGRKTKRGKK